MFEIKPTKRSSSKGKKTTDEQVELYDTISRLLEAAFDEVKDFSKKNPDTALNDRKVKSLNRILKDIKDLMANEPTASYMETLDEEMLPSNSDVVLTMSQYRSALENYRKKYRRYHNFDNFWHTTEGEIIARDLEGDRPQWK